MAERLTETQRINTIREALQEKAQSGLLGVIAARSRVAEYQLLEWCKEPSKVPTYGELIDIQDALGIQILLQETSYDAGTDETHWPHTQDEK